MSESSERKEEEALLREMGSHLGKLKLRSALSAACFGAFLVFGVLVLLSGRSLAVEDGLTLALLGLIIAAFLLLPRDYIPSALAREAVSDESVQQLDRMRRLQRLGLIQRIIYILMVVIVLIGVPWLMSRT